MIARTKVLFLMTFICVGMFSFNSLACPDLTGTYSSEYNGIKFTAHVETKAASAGHTYYVFTAGGETIEIHADGKLRNQKTTQDFPHLKHRKYAAHCRGGKVNYWETAQITDENGRVIGQHYQLVERSADNQKMTVDFLDMRDVFNDGRVDAYPSFSHTSQRIIK